MADMGYEIVISGLTGKFPKSENVQEFKENLFKGVEMTSEQQFWDIDDERFPKRIGKIRSFKEFDASYFGILPKQADAACPMSRVLLEAAYEAIIDAGVNPDSMRGKKCGVYIATNATESSQVQFEPLEARSATRGAMTIISCGLSGRISFWLGVTGPTIVMDTGCSTSLFCLNSAVRDIKSGLCDSALVGGANMILLPYFTRAMAADKLLSPEGRCHSFDAEANGFVRSEAVTMVFLQKSTVARRVYCTILGTRTGCEGFKEEGMAHTCGVAQTAFLQECYKEARINPLSVDYVDGHGPGTKAGDPEEVYALNEVFAKGRGGPFTIGSVKSNMGHAEPLAGHMSLTKVILAMENGTMPGTLHYKNPNPDIPALVAGSVRVFNKNQPFDGDIVGINAFGVSGSLAHVILRRHEKVKQVQPIDYTIPWLIVCSGRTEEAVKTMCRQSTEGGVDPELVKMMNDLHLDDIKNHLYRGYTVVNGRGLKFDGVSSFSGVKRPICFVFSGMGSQWPQMGKELLKIPAFADSIAKCDAVLKPKGIDIYRIISNNEPGLFDYILNSFVGVIAMQVAFVDTLASLGIKPDLIVGQSLGELPAAYADGALTLEETLLSAYFRGKLSVECVFAPGVMAIVGMNHQELERIVPDGVEVACHNGPTSTVISGAKASVRKFIEYLEDNKVFVKEIPWSCNIPYHSSFVKHAVPKFLGFLNKVITDPKLRSPKWISSSVKDEDLESPLGLYSSPEYHCHNFSSPVLFKEAFEKVPDDAIVIEIAPSGLMESTMNDFGKSNTTIITLSKKRCPDNLRYFICSLGRIYAAGGHPDVSNLYKFESYPVSRGTKMLSPMVRWDHDREYYVPQYDDEKKCGKTFMLLDSDEENDYKVDGNADFPFSKCLVVVWKTLASIYGRKMENTAVVFSSISFHAPIILDGLKTFQVEVKKDTGYFQVTVEDTVHVSGNIRLMLPEEEAATVTVSLKMPEKNTFAMTKDGFYKELKLQGLEVSESYKNLVFVDSSLTFAEVKWTQDWAAAVECLFHLGMIQTSTRNVQRIKKIKKMVIEPEKMTQTSDGSTFLVTMDPMSQYISCNALQISALEFNSEKPKRTHDSPVLETFEFVPHVKTGNTSVEEAVHLCIHLATENMSMSVCKILEIHSKEVQASPLSPHVIEAYKNLPTDSCEIFTHGLKPIPGTTAISNLSSIYEESIHILIFKGEFYDDVEQYLPLVHKDGFVILQSDIKEEIELFRYGICVDYCLANQRITMLRRKQRPKKVKLVELKDETDFDWMTTLRNHPIGDDAIFLIVANEPSSGVVGLSYCLMQEMSKKQIRVFFSFGEDVQPFSIDSSFFDDQLLKGLVLNVSKDNVFGSFRHFPIKHCLKPCQHVSFSSDGIQEGPLNRNPENGDEKVNVFYSGKLVQLNPTNDDTQQFLMEFSGKCQDGSRVMGIAILPYESLLSTVEADPDLLWDVPLTWTLSDAAAASIPYCQALTVLNSLSKSCPGQTILVTGADSNLGLAVITTALRYKYNVFGVCSSTAGLQLLNILIADLPKENLFELGDSACLRTIKNKCNGGKGVDVLIHLGEQLTYEQGKCLRSDGTIILLDQTVQIDLNFLPESLSVKRINFAAFISKRENKKYLSAGMKTLLENKIVAPVSTKVPIDRVNPEELSEASKTSLGKQVIKWREEGKADNEKVWLAAPRVWFDPSLSYIILGGLGGFGLELTNWMIKRGASKFVLCSRSGIRNGYQSYLLRHWKTYGAEVVVLTDDITTEDGVKRIISTANSMGSVGGFFHLAVDLDRVKKEALDQDMEGMNAIRCKATKLFDQWSRLLCPKIQFFVTFSSYVAGRGNTGLLSYAYSSSRMDRLCELRSLDGFPATSIQWGPIGSVGILENSSSTGVPGADFQDISSCLAALDTLLNQKSAVVASCVMTPKEAVESKHKTVLGRVLELMGISDTKTTNLQATLSELGMESLLAVKIKSVLENEFQISLCLPQVRKLTLTKCSEMDEKKE